MTAEEVEEYTKTCRGKELPGFLNYKTFEEIIKKHLEELEEPFMKLLTNITEIVPSSVISSHFTAFSNLLRAAKEHVEDLLEQEKEKAQKGVKSQFKMETFVFSQDPLYNRWFEELKFQNIPLSCNTEMNQHINAYFWITSEPLANQLPLIMQYHMLDQYFSQLQTAMLAMIGSQNAQKLLQEDSDVAHKRKILKDRLGRLKEARQLLFKFVRST